MFGIAVKWNHDEWTAWMQESANDGIEPEIFIRTHDRNAAATEVNLYTNEKNINRNSSPFVWWLASEIHLVHEASPSWTYKFWIQDDIFGRLETFFKNQGTIRGIISSVLIYIIFFTIQASSHFWQLIGLKTKGTSWNSSKSSFTIFGFEHIHITFQWPQIPILDLLNPNKNTHKNRTAISEITLVPTNLRK